MSSKKYLIAVQPDGTITKTDIDKAPSLEDLKEIVGGFIEMIPYFTSYDGEHCVAFCNEYGKLPHVNLPRNEPAQILWERAYGGIIVEDYLVGPIAIVVGPPQFLNRL